MALLMCLALALGVCPAFSLAEDVATELTEPGQTAEAIFMVTANPNHAIGAMLELEYDHTALTLIPNDFFHQDWLAIGDLAGIPTGKEIRALFRVTDHAQPGTVYLVQLRATEAYDVNEKAVEGLELSSYMIIYGPTPTVTPTPKPKPTAVPTSANAFEYTIKDNEVTINKYIGKDKTVIIPERIEGKKVTSIGNYAFWNCPGLNDIILPDGITTIGDYAFSGCVGLTSITLPNNTKNILHYAFLRCVRLTQITLPASVEYIGNLAFNGCSENLEIAVERGSYTERYCKENSLKFNYR